MRKVFIVFVSLFLIDGLAAQINPYEDLGIEVEVLTLSKGKYQEFHDLDSIQQIGTVLINLNTREIVGHVEQDTVPDKYYLPKFSSSRFISVDPIAENFPWISPYSYAANNPIKFIDYKGLAPMPPGAIIGMERLANGNFSHYSVSATVYIYGSASSGDVASSLNQSVNGIWNNPDSPAGTRRRAGQNYSPVEFNINFVHVSTDEAKSLASSNTDKAVNFMNIVDEDGASSFFEGNSGQLNLQMQGERNETTGAHEIGHMMGFRSTDPDDNTHFTDNSDYFGILPLMYSGKNPNLDQRVRTGADVKGLNIWQNKWQGDGYLGEDINNKIYDK